MSFKELPLLLSLTQLANAMKGAPVPRLEPMLPFLNAAMAEANINTPQRVAAFLAQLGHESMSLRYMEEIASGAAYEGRRDLGNVQTGDGKRFKGRGPIQITGRANYKAVGDALGVDFVAHPEMAALPEYGFRTAAWFWTSRGLNALADQDTLDSFKRITRKINGGLNGWPDRVARWATAKKALGVK